MTDALRYEWVRLRTIRSTWWISGIALVLGMGVSALLGWAVHHDLSTKGSSDLGSVHGVAAFVITQLAATGQIPSLVAFLLAVIGVLAWGHEYRHGMIRASLTALSSRTNLWVAKYLVVGLWVVVVHLVTMLACLVVAWIYLHSYVDVVDGRTVEVAAWQLFSTLLLTWLAMAVTQLTRSQVFSLVGLFLWPLLVESLINLVFALVPGLRDHTGILRFLPFSAQKRMTDALVSGSSLFGNPLTPLGGAIVFGGLTVVLMAIGYALFQRRDA